MSVIEVGADGWYHPTTTADLQALVKWAHDEGGAIQVRPRGAGLSTKAAIPEIDGKPPSGVTGVSLDRMNAVGPLVEQADGTALVGVQAGCLLGPAYDDVDGRSWPASLTYVLQRQGYALSQLAGVSHQAVGGFLQTGSAGGSIAHSLYDDLMAVELVDGRGQLRHYRRPADDDPDDPFWGVGTAMGLCGVVTELTLRVHPTYNVRGRELTVELDRAPIDLLGEGDGARPSLAQYLRATPYARILWWPQKDLNRVQIWEVSERLAPTDDFEPRPFEIMGRFSSLIGSLLLTIIGNADDLDPVPPRLGRWAARFDRWLDREPSTAGRPVFGQAPEAKRGWRGAKERLWSDRITEGVRYAVAELLDGSRGERLGKLLQRLAPGLTDELLPAFVRNEDKPFQDWWLCGLPMDNLMEEALWHTELSELWIPLERAAEVVAALASYYAAGGDEDLAYERTGPFALELYGGAASPFWMSPGFGGPCLRVNVFWFAGWQGRSRAELYQGIWELLKPFDFRVHWGKNAPGPSPDWIAYHRRQLPKMTAFLALQSELDPEGIFVSDYYREHLGI